MMYVLLDGFDLGVGILFPWIKQSEYRDIMMSSVVPVWDGNETGWYLVRRHYMLHFQWHMLFYCLLYICR